MQYMLRPEVPGELGQDTILDSSVHPPIIEKLHFIFKGWLEDDIIKCFPIFMVTEKLAAQLLASNVTGFELRDCIVEISGEFKILQPETKLPRFLWLNILSKKADTDFFINDNNKLIASQKAFDVLLKFNIKHCEITIIKGRSSFWKAFFSS